MGASGLYEVKKRPSLLLGSVTLAVVQLLVDIVDIVLPAIGKVLSLPRQPLPPVADDVALRIAGSGTF